MIIVATKLDPPAYLVRFHDNLDIEYSRTIVVIVEGDTLFLMGYLSRDGEDDLTAEDWRQAREQVGDFKHAKYVRFERRKPGQARRFTKLRI